MEARNIKPVAKLATKANKSVQNPRPGSAAHFAALSGRPPRTVRRQMRLAKMFTSDELEILGRHNLTQQKMEEISRIGDKTKRKKVIALIDSGMEFNEAYKEVTGQEPDLTSRTKAEKQLKAAAKQEMAPELTDDDWFEAKCGEKAKLLGDTKSYKADALLYRDIIEARAKFRSAVEAALDKRKKAGPVGFLWRAINRIISLTHPREWPVCEKCTGKGKTEDGMICRTCKGACFDPRED